MWIIIVGNPTDGYRFWGPFGSQREALYYDERLVGNAGDSWVVKLNAAPVDVELVRPDGPETAKGGLVGQEPH